MERTKRYNNFVIHRFMILLGNFQFQYTHYFEMRTEAVQKLKKTDCHPYPHKFQTNLTLKDLSAGEGKESETVTLAGKYLCHSFINGCNHPVKQVYLYRTNL